MTRWKNQENNKKATHDHNARGKLHIISVPCNFIFTIKNHTITRRKFENTIILLVAKYFKANLTDKYFMRFCLVFFFLVRFFLSRKSLSCSQQHIVGSVNFNLYYFIKIPLIYSELPGKG